MAEEQHQPCPTPFYETCELMKQLAGLANMDYAPIRKMVLVLDVNAVPVLYVESFLDKNRLGDEPLNKIHLKVVNGKIVITDSGSKS